MDSIAGKYSDKVAHLETGNEDKYFVATIDAEMTVTISPNWIGYDLNIKKEVFGKEFGEAVDTDNYQLNSSNANITKDIIAETQECLIGLLEGRVYAGLDDSDPVLAIPLPNGNFRLKRFRTRNKWWHLFDTWTSTVMSENDVRQISYLRALL